MIRFLSIVTLGPLLWERSAMVTENPEAETSGAVWRGMEITNHQKVLSSPIEPSRIVRSKLQCAVMCSTINQQQQQVEILCSGFTYNKETRECTLGSRMELKASTPRDSALALYFNTDKLLSCPSSYATLDVNGVINCFLYVPEEDNNHADAQSYCDAEGGQLVSLVDPQKIEVLKEAYEFYDLDKGHKVWLGLSAEVQTMNGNAGCGGESGSSSETSGCTGDDGGSSGGSDSGTEEKVFVWRWTTGDILNVETYDEDMIWGSSGEDPDKICAIHKDYELQREECDKKHSFFCEFSLYSNTDE